MRDLRISAGCLAAWLLAACVGKVDGEGGSPGGAPMGPDATPGRTSSSTSSTGAAPTAPPPGAAVPATPGATVDTRRAPGPAAGRRLTRDEYVNSVADILNLDLASEKTTLPDETPAGGFRNSVAALVPSPMRTAAYETLAVKVASAVKWTGGLAVHAACTEATTACESGLVRTLGRLFYRRALTEREVGNLTPLFLATRGQPAPFETGTRLVLEALLQSPFFLYRLESTASLAPSGPELATRLSYFFLKSTPPRTLLDAAERGDLASDPGVGRAVADLLRDERSKRGLRAYTEDWLQLYRTDTRAIDPGRGVTADLLREMKEETLAFVSRVALDGQDLMTLFTDRTADLGPALAGLYGLTPLSAGIRRYMLPADSRRIGILTQAAVLGAHAGVGSVSLVDRGVTVLRTFLCGDVPAPPDGATTKLMAVAATLTERERFAIHGADPSCSGCHQRIDPLGQPFEPYDLAGKHRLKDQHGNTLRDDGVVDLDGAKRPYGGVTAFAGILGASGTAEACLVAKLHQYAFGRPAQAADEVTLVQVTRRFREAGRTYRALAEALATSPAFLSLAQEVRQ